MAAKTQYDSVSLTSDTFDVDETEAQTSVIVPKPGFWTGKKKLVIILIVTILIILGGVFAVIFLTDEGPRQHRNVIFLVPDGYGPAYTTLTVHMNGDKPLEMDSYLVGTSRTRSADSPVTDSAAGATSWACGLRTNNHYLAATPENTSCGTLMEAAMNQKNMKAGFVVTSEVTHATPAAFTSHSISRYWKEFIAGQQIKSGLEVMFGGGRTVFTQDNNTLWKEAESNGLNIITTAAELSGDVKLPVLGLFADKHLAFSLDREVDDVEPSLVQMTKKALDILNKDNKDGFFLLVEGSRIDHCGHINDPSCAYHEVNAFDEAFKAVIDFAKEDKNTLVVSVADHETGGLALGVGEYNYGLDFLSQVNHTCEWFVAQLDLAALNSTENLQKLEEDIGTYTPIDTLTPEEVSLIQNGLATSPVATEEALAAIFSARGEIGWTSHVHTGVDVNVYAYGPDSDKFAGQHKNYDLGVILAKILGFDYDKATQDVKSFDPTNNSSMDSTKRDVGYHSNNIL